MTFYGKPHTPVFRAVERSMNVVPDRLLMVGDSLEHDISGAAKAGWATLFGAAVLMLQRFRQGTFKRLWPTSWCGNLRPLLISPFRL
ncbi:HAD hydrolase-like protein [Pseudooctadecabacter sp.]